MKSCLLLDSLQSLLLTSRGMFFRMVGGWLDISCLCRGGLCSFLYGRFVLVFRFRVTSRKLVIFLFTSAVTLSRIQFEEHSQRCRFICLTAAQTENFFPNCLQTFYTVWKLSRPFKNFTNCPETFQTVQKLSRLSVNLPGCPETFQTVRKLFRHT